MRRSLFGIVLLTALGIVLSAQVSDTEKVLFTPDFRFNDGIYVEFEQVRGNKPIPKSKILTSADYNDRDFFNIILENDKIYYYDAIGIRQEIEKSEIWGYSRNGILYIQIQGNFNRITFVGSLCHFVADITTYDRRYYGSPYNYYDPYSYSSYSYSNYYNPYYSPYYMPYRPTTVAKNELVQYVLDFETGKIIEYDIKNIEMLLMKDPDLYQEFISLSRKKKKQMLFFYIRKFNEKKPIYLPKS
ncbi:MAG TPA: hypothetical protein VMW76_00095 [Bacteroidales bacterium]|nr:hypothetical protein [Bacteroidales bacterium]